MTTVASHVSTVYNYFCSVIRCRDDRIWFIQGIQTDSDSAGEDAGGQSPYRDHVRLCAKSEFCVGPCMLGRLGVSYKHISSEIGSQSICALIPTVCTPLVKTTTIHA